ncbi:hypothetical protein PoB_002176500 [Plakobranchus ocellatus]|uniref:Methyltransferase FkbM domain-containing protein n=1 Tax=Plakobranchus ocellatus TaxID=259542 RepID=A0AAV3ZL26_9GAST|nr:hypothetical protein PoB_002176500 [Plakobranchus ocellatus]
MIPRTKVKVLVILSGVLVCAYLMLSSFSGQRVTQQLDPQIGGHSQSNARENVRSIQHAPSKQHVGNAVNQQARPEAAIQVGNQAGIRAGSQLGNQAGAPQVRYQGQPVVSGHQPLAMPGQQGLILQQGVPQQQLILNPVAPRQAALKHHQGFNHQSNIFQSQPNQQGVVQMQGFPQQIVAANQGIPQQENAAFQGISQDFGANQIVYQQGNEKNQEVFIPQDVVSNQRNALDHETVQQGELPNQRNSKQEAASNPQPTEQKEEPDIAVLIARQLGLHPDVKVVPSYVASGVKMPQVECVPLPKSPRNGVKICIYPTKEDRWVSGSLKKNKLWEENLVLSMQKTLQADPSMMLLDLGCNLGMYALFAAAMNRSVVAVEMLPANIRMIQKSLQLSGLSGSVLLVNNALYRDHRTLETKFMLSNIGGSRLNTSKVYENIDSRLPAVSVQTICLDDLAPLVKDKTVFMKMDIENSEHHALACAHNFFTDVHVKVVQIEWLHRTQEEATLISDFMTQHGYVPTKSSLSYKPIDLGSYNKSQDIFFLKKSSLNFS